MGGCCCSARKPHLHGSTAYYYYAPTLDDHDTFASHDGPVPSITSGLLVDLNLEASVFNNFRAPPAPLPYDVVLSSQSTETDSFSGRASSFNTFNACRDPLATDNKSQSIHLVISPKKLAQLPKSDEIDIFAAADEEDVCPICIEEYDKENPRLMTKCEHHFHLSCILEWMERSGICPICDKVLVLDHSLTNGSPTH